MIIHHCTPGNRVRLSLKKKKERKADRVPEFICLFKIGRRGEEGREAMLAATSVLEQRVTQCPQC